MRSVLGAALIFLASGAVKADTGYVTRQNTGQILIVDLSTGITKSSIPTGAGSLSAIAASSDGKTLYATNGVEIYYGASVVFVDLERGLIGHAGVGSVPVEIALLPDGRKAYTANWFGGSVSIVDTASRTTLGTLATEFLTNDVTASPDGRWMYATSLYANVIYVIDTSTDQIARTIPLFRSGVRHLAIGADGAKAYVQFGNEILKVDVASATIEKSIPFDGTGGNANNIDFDMEVSPDGSTLYANGTQVVNKIDLSQDRIVAQIPVAPAGMRLDDIAVDPTGAFVYVTTSPEFTQDLPRSEVVKIDATGNRIQDRFVIGGVLSSLAIGTTTNPPPVALCRPITVVADSRCLAEGSVDSGSYDPDGGLITLDQSPPGPYGPGITEVLLTVTDEDGQSESCRASVTVIDETPPQLIVNVDPAVVWPPNHRMVEVGVSIIETDACGLPAVVLAGATSSEPDDVPGSGDGSTTGDIQDAAIGTADTGLLLRAERSGDGPGRVYTLTYVARDASGNMATAQAIVTVPHDEGTGPEPVSLGLELEGIPGMAHLYWNAVSGAEAYDLIQGELSEMKAQEGVVRLGPVHVLASGQIGTNYSEEPSAALPPVGRALFYLVQYRTGPTASGWGTESSPWPAEPTSCDTGCPGDVIGTSIAAGDPFPK